MDNFVHLHVHSEYSLLDGAARIKDMTAYAAKMGAPAVAITDHGSMYGAIDFYKSAKAAGVKPIIGSEFYVARRGIHDKTSRDGSHLVLLAKNNEGYKNLIKLSSISFIEGFYYRPRIDYDLLQSHSDGLVCLSACLAGDIPSLLLNGSKNEAMKLAQRLKDMFGNDFYIELQDHGILEQRQVNPMLIELAKTLDIPVVATNDVHYVKREDAKVQDMLMCMQLGRYLDEGGLFEGEEFYMKSAEEMSSLFPYAPQAISATLEIADKCNLEFEFGNLHLPSFDVAGSHDEYIEKLARDGIQHRYPNPNELEERLVYELETIKRMGFTDYFLIVADYVNFARKSKIMVGAGRGSAAGSLVAYALGITDVDPIKYNLLFERFLNPERISMPDIDIDFCYERRQEIIDYVVQKYGSERVAQIVTFGTMGARQVVRDVARTMRISVAESDRIAKLIPFELRMTIERALSVEPRLKEEYESNPTIHNWIDMAIKLEGMPRHVSTHAAGVVISKEAVTEYVPLAKNQSDESITTQYTMNHLEDMGLLKMDFLGLRTLTVIRNAVNMIRDKKGIEVDIDRLEPDDPKVYALISSGHTDGIFQLESEGMRSLMMQLKPNNIGDIMVGISLFRPGPMAKIPDYVYGKNNPDNIRYAHPIIERVLGDTYGCMVYQEQVMEIVRDMAGYSLGRSDLVRRAMAKKKKDVMERERDTFINGGEGVDGALKRGVSLDVAADIFDQMMDFAEYAFNKSHACAYAIISYQTAYLKCYYELEFMTSLLNSFISNSDKLFHYIKHVGQSGIKLLKPDINHSEKYFSVEGDGIRFGLNALKYVGGAIGEVISERKNGLYKDMVDFVNRNVAVLNKPLLESLVLAGCFDFSGIYRSQLMATYEQVFRSEQNRMYRGMEGQDLFFDEEDDRVPIPDIPEYENEIKLSFEKEKSGLYLSGHPMMGFKVPTGQKNESVADILRAEHDASAAKYYDGRYINIFGILSEIKTRTAKSSKRQMARGKFEDLSGIINFTMFPTSFEYNADMLQPDKIVRVSARVSIEDERPPELILDEIYSIEQSQQKVLYLQVEKENAKELEKILGMQSGADSVRVKIKGASSVYGYSAKVDRFFVQNLQHMLGEENVKLVKKG